MEQEPTHPSNEEAPGRKISQARTDEDKILIAALQLDRTDQVWQAMYRVYRQPFIAFFQKGLSWEEAKINDLFEEVSKIFKNEVFENGNHWAGKVIIFQQLLVMGYHHCKKHWKNVFWSCPLKLKWWKMVFRLFKAGWNKNVDFADEILRTGIHYESHALLLLLENKHNYTADKFCRTIPLAVESYFMSTERYKLIKNTFGLSEVDWEEFKQESITIFLTNVHDGKVEPREATLTTYFKSIYWNTVSNYLTQRKKVVLSGNEWLLESPFQKDQNIDDERSTETVLDKDERKAMRDYIDDEHWTLLLIKYYFKNEKELVERLMKDLSKTCKKYESCKEKERCFILDAHYIKGFPFSKIAELTGEKENAVKTQASRCRTRLRNLLQIEKKDRKKRKQDDGDASEKKDQKKDR